jgi:hypothetical protein
MIHARSDYDRIQDPALSDLSLLSEGSSPIGKNEPVFLIRASDQAFPATLAVWIELHLKAGGEQEMADAVARHINKAISWQKENRRKIADAPRDVLKV